MKKSLILVVALLCMASLMAAMAYSSATVTNAAELKIVNTNQALLSLEPNANWNWGDNMAGTKDGTAVMKDGELFFQLGKGKLGFNGLQPNSEYIWNSLFTMRNKSAETINVTVRAEGNLAQYITFGAGHRTSPTWGDQGQPYSVGTIKPQNAGGDMWNIRHIAVRVTVPSGATVSQEEILGSIIVESDAVNQ